MVRVGVGPGVRVRVGDWVRVLSRVGPEFKVRVGFGLGLGLVLGLGLWLLFVLG